MLEKDSKLRKWLIISGIVTSVLLLALAIYLLLTKRQVEEVTLNHQETVNTEDKLSEDWILKDDPTDVPTWITNDPMLPENGPWYGSLKIATSEDGLEFENEKHFLDHAGVPDLLLTEDDILVAVFQYFSFVDEEMFDKIAYATSEDFGETWSEIKLVRFSNLKGGHNAVDPTLVQLDDGRFRLYFTYHEHGQMYPQLFSAVSDTLEGDFVSEGIQLETDFVVLDPAVVKFNGKWHHYSVKHGSSLEDTFSNDSVSIHSVSDDGTGFELADNIDIGIQFLGNVIPFGDGLRFYGSSNSTGYSEDGYTWALEENTGPDGADPGIAQLPDGSFISVYTR